MAAFSSHIRYLIGPPVAPIVGWALSGLVLHFGGALVHRLAQRLAGLEVRHALFGDVDAFAGTRVAAHAGRAPVDREAAEAADLDAVPAHERVAHRVEDRLDGVLGVAMGELAETAGQFFDEIGSGHGQGGARTKARPALALLLELRLEQRA